MLVEASVSHIYCAYPANVFTTFVACRLLDKVPTSLRPSLGTPPSRIQTPRTPEGTTAVYRLFNSFPLLSKPVISSSPDVTVSRSSLLLTPLGLRTTSTPEAFICVGLTLITRRAFSPSSLDSSEVARAHRLSLLFRNLPLQPTDFFRLERQ